MAGKWIALRWAASCSSCSTDIPAGENAWWDSTAKSATCAACELTEGSVVDAEIDAGVAGASAARQYRKKSERERRRKEAAKVADAERRDRLKQQHPILGRVVSAMTPKPVVGPESQSTAAWSKGAAGEQRVGEVLDACRGVRALHDRRIAGSKANIDHIAVGPAGIFVIDAKRYAGEVAVRDVGGWFRSDQRLYVGGRDRTKVVQAMVRQVDVVNTAVLESLAAPGVRVFPILCFVGATWPVLFRRPLVVRGVTVTWPKKLPDHVARQGPLTAEQIERLARHLADRLPPA